MNTFGVARPQAPAKNASRLFVTRPLVDLFLARKRLPYSAAKAARAAFP
jgi:hypothetical protein